MSPAGLSVLEHYGVVILPALAVAEQLGVPLPAMPALLAVGALAAHGRTSIPLVLGAISLAALATDFAWYELGRRRGARVLANLRRLSVERDSCMHRAERVFARHGARSMLVAKFVPGLSTSYRLSPACSRSREGASPSMTSRAYCSGQVRG